MTLKYTAKGTNEKKFQWEIEIFFSINELLLVSLGTQKCQESNTSNYIINTHKLLRIKTPMGYKEQILIFLSGIHCTHAYIVHWCEHYSTTE